MYVNTKTWNPVYDGSNFILLLFLTGYVVTNIVLSRDQPLAGVWTFNKQPTLYPIHKLCRDGGSPA